MADLFENLSRVEPLEIKGDKRSYEILNDLSGGTLERISVECRSGSFPNLFVEPEIHNKGLLKSADFFTTELDLSKVPEMGKVETSWRNTLWHDKTNLNVIENMVILPGPPDALDVSDLPNRIYTRDARELVDFVYKHGVEERPGKVRFAGWDVDPLYQIESNFFIEPVGNINRLPFVNRKSKLEIKLRRWDVLGSYSGADWMGTASIEQGRLGKTNLILRLDETLKKMGSIMGTVKMEMPDTKTSKVSFEFRNRSSNNSSDLNTLLEEDFYDRWIDNGRNKLTRHQMIVPLIKSLGMAMGIK